METAQLCEIFMKTLDPNNEIREGAESSLKEISSDPRFIFSLFSLIGNQDVVDHFRLIAATTLKNNVKARSDRASVNPFSEEERKFLWENLPELMCRSHSLTSAQLLVSLSLLIDYCSTKEDILALFDKVIAFTSSNDMKSVCTGFTIFHTILKSLSWFGLVSSEHRDTFFEKKMLPKMLFVAQELVSHNSTEAGDLMKLTIKTYYTLMSKMSPSHSIFRSERLLDWCKVFTSVISKNLYASIPAEEMENSNWFKAVKWSYKCINYLMGKCNDASDESVEERKLFKNHYAVEIYKVVDEQLKTYMNGVPTTAKIKQHLAIFLISCVYFRSTWIMLKENVMNIISMFVLPMIIFDDELEELWDQNPTEYILECMESTMSEYFGPRSASLRFLHVLAKERYAHVFMHLMSYLTQMLRMDCSGNQSIAQVRQRYGFYMMTSVLAPLALNKNSQVRNEMEQFAATIIVPDMKSECAFIRQAACDAFSKLEGLDWKEDKNLVFAIDGILENLNRPEMQIRVSASLALRSVLGNEVVMNYIRPRAHEIVQILQNLNKELDLDEISDTIEVMAANFYAGLMPFITSLVRSLVESIIQSIALYNGNAAETNDSSSIADDNYDIIAMIQSHLKIITTYIMTMKDYKNVVEEIDGIVEPAIKSLFESRIAEAYGDAFETLEVIAYCSKSISQNLWAFAPTVFDIVICDPEECVDPAVNLIDHYIDYGRSTFVMNPECREKVYRIVESILTKDSYSYTNSSRIRACEIIESLALNLRGEINEAVHFFLKLILPHIMEMNSKTTSTFMVFALEVVVNMIYYNPQITLSYLESVGALAHFFILWFDTLHRFKRLHDKKLCILAIAEILSMPHNLLPQSLNDKNTFAKVIQALSELLESYPKVFSEFEKEKLKKNDDCGSDGQADSDETSLGGQTDGDINEDFADEYGFNNCGDEDEDENDEDEWDADELSEDVYLITGITGIDPYPVVKSALQTQSTAERINQYLTDAERANLINIIEAGEMMSKKVREDAGLGMRNDLDMLYCVDRRTG